MKWTAKVGRSLRGGREQITCIREHNDLFLSTIKLLPVRIATNPFRFGSRFKGISLVYQPTPATLFPRPNLAHKKAAVSV